MAICPVCGSRIQDWTSSCPRCNTPLDWEQRPLNQDRSDEDNYDYDDEYYGNRYMPQNSRRYRPQGFQKNRSTWPIIGGVAAILCACVCVCCFVLVIAGALVSENELPTTARNTSSSKTGRVGERVESGGIALTVLGVSKTRQIGEFVEPNSGSVYLVIEVVIENASRDETPYNPLYFKAKDSDGFEYNTAAFAPDPGLKSGSLARGDRARGFVAFEVRDTARGLVVTYEPLVLLGGYEPIRIELGQ
jgi:hypothetical protein